ncbi:MAG TPA: hypothetical protein VGX68_03645 [Thermoanaerobaculia bacterium]|jgi:hypothetical protein|nr:hypothetical protein [Thermoanaerobaculia bacterium]
MPNENKQEHLLVQAVYAFAQGCGAAKIDDAASQWFHERYSKWLGKKKDHPKVEGTPHQVWKKHGTEFLGRFHLMGQRAAAKGSPIMEENLKEAARTVEMESACPYCPDPGDI